MHQVINSFYIGEDSPEHLMNPSTQYFFIQLMQLSDFFENMHFNAQLDSPHPVKLPKQFTHLVDSSVFSIIHFSTLSCDSTIRGPQLPSAFLTSFFLEIQISLSSWLHCRDFGNLPVSLELNRKLSYREERNSLWGKTLSPFKDPIVLRTFVFRMLNIA